jgi:hypothetical protein
VETVSENCKLQFSLTIAILAILSNATKASCMLWIVWKCRDRYVVTYGDALAAFLADPDPATKGCCLCDEGKIDYEWK